MIHRLQNFTGDGAVGARANKKIAAGQEAAAA
jgi:hypothetical protein